MLDLKPELRPADLMEAAIASTVSVCASFQGGYRYVRTMAIWSDPYCSYECFVDVVCKSFLHWDVASTLCDGL